MDIVYVFMMFGSICHDSHVLNKECMNVWEIYASVSSNLLIHICQTPKLRTPFSPFLYYFHFFSFQVFFTFFFLLNFSFKKENFPFFILFSISIFILFYILFLEFYFVFFHYLGNKLSIFYRHFFPKSVHSITFVRSPLDYNRMAWVWPYEAQN